MSDYSWHTRGGNDAPTQEYICGFCNKTVAGFKHSIIEFEGYHPGYGTTRSDAYYVLECPSCNRPTVYEVKDGTTFPFTKALQPVKHLSDNINAIYNEVRTAIGSGCYTSAVILARTAIMHIAIEQNAEENKSFVYYVNYLVDEGYVPPNAKDWIDKIRVMANDCVHHLEIWGKEDAETIGNFLMYLLVFVYELPASV